MTKKEELKFFDPQIEVKEKAVAERLQFVPGTKIPLPSEVEISESGMCNRKCSFCPRSDPNYPHKNEFISFDLHKKLTDEEGYDPKSDEYYSEIDKRIRLEFPHKFDNNEDKVQDNTTKPTQIVASAKRSVNKSGRRTVRLTPSQVAIAKKLGVPLEEYAKQMKITKEV